MRSSGRILGVWTLATLVAGALLATLLPALVPAGGGFPDLLVAGCSAAGVAATGWLWLLVTLVVLEALRGRPARAAVPTVVRRVVLAACGLTLAGGLAVPAHADRPAPPPEDAVLSGLPLPDRATSTSAWLASVAARDARDVEPPQAEPTARSTVRVAPGDTLWSLARDTLPPDAGTAEIDRRWREIYAANRDPVGADPDLIRPGQRLVLPPLPGSHPA